MTLLKRGTIKSYDAGTHEATVGIAGSLGVWLADIPVHMGVRPDDIVAGLECGVLFFTDDNPSDAVVVTVHGDVPAAIVATTDLIRDADNDTKVQAEEAADEDKLRFDVAATQRYLIQDASIHHQWVGTGYLSPGPLFVGDATTGSGWLNVTKALGTVTTAQALFDMGGTLTLGANTLAVTGLTSAPVATAGAGTSGHTLRGLNFFATFGGTGAFAEMTAARLRFGLTSSGAHTAARGLWLDTFFSLGFTGTIASMRGIHIQNQGHSSITDVYGIDLDAITAGTNRYGIRVADISGGTIARLLELTNAMRVEGTGNWTPTANQTPVIIYEGATPTARRVQWIDPGAGGANFAGGERVMVLV